MSFLFGEPDIPPPAEPIQQTRQPERVEKAGTDARRKAAMRSQASMMGPAGRSDLEEATTNKKSLLGA